MAEASSILITAPSDNTGDVIVPYYAIDQEDCVAHYGYNNQYTITHRREINQTAL